MKSTWICDDCGASHSRRDKNVGLNLKIPDLSPGTKRSDLEDNCLDNYFADEALEGIECGSAVCNGKKDTRLRSTKIVGGPEILVIQIARMRIDKYGRSRKVMRRIDYEERLDLGEWSIGPLKYQLNGIVAHSGPSLRQGHYVSMVRCQNGTDFAYCNDESVEAEPEKKESILQRAESSSFQSYLLVYQKIGGKMEKVI